jgi:hypothetical protein
MINKDVIPGVSESELAGAVRSLTRIPEIALDARELFTIEVRSIVEFRAQSGWQNEGSDDMAAFLHVPYPRPMGDKFGAVPVYDLKATGDSILGKLFLLNRDASSGRAMSFPSKPNELLEWLADNGLGEYPLVIVHRNAKLLYYRKNGSQGDARSEKIRDIPPVVSVEELEDALRVSHRESLLTPMICPDGVWKKGAAAKYIPGPTPEKAIQKMLKIALTSWFRGLVRAEMEDSISVGRIDIRLLREDQEGNLGYWAILELKVIKSYHHATGKKKATAVADDENAAAVAEGVRQARAFGKDRNAEAFLDVFDLRKDKAANILDHALVVTELDQCALKPRSHIWPLFGSASDARLAGWP